MVTIPTAAEMTAAIHALREVYAAQGHTLYDIGNGLCFEFAEDLMRETFGKDWIHFESTSPRWCTLATEQLLLPPDGEETTIYAQCWDWDVIETQWGISLSREDQARFDDIVVQGPYHCWVYLDGRHYDCEHPEGVENFFELNFFRRWRAIGAAQPSN